MTVGQTALAEVITGADAGGGRPVCHSRTHLGRDCDTGVAALGEASGARPIYLLLNYRMTNISSAFMTVVRMVGSASQTTKRSSM